MQRPTPLPIFCIFQMSKCLIPKDLLNRLPQVFENKRDILQLLENKRVRVSWLQLVTVFRLNFSLSIFHETPLD